MSVDSEVGKLDIVLNADGAKASAEIDKFNQKLDEMVARAQKAGSTMASSNDATLRSIEGVAAGLQKHGQAIDTLGSRVDAFTGKSHTAWLAIGTVVGGTTETMINKVLGFIDKVNKMPEAVDAAAFSMQQKDWLGTDEVRKANDLLEQNLAIMQKRSVNNVALAADEARIVFDKLAASAKSANTEIESALSRNHIAAWHALLGTRGTADVEGSVNAFNQQIQDLAEESQIAAHDGDGARAAAKDQERRNKIAAGRKWDKEKLEASKDGVYDNRGGIRSDILLQDAHLADAQDADTEADRTKRDEAANRKQQEADRRAAQAREAAAAAKAAQQQRDSAEMKRLGESFADHQASRIPEAGETAGDSAGADANWWLTQATSLEKGSGNFLEVMKRANQSLSAENKNTAEEWAKYRGLLEGLSKEQTFLSVADQGRETQRSDEALRRYIESLKAGGMASLQFARSGEDVRLELQLEQGEIGQADYVLQQSLLHAQRYAEDRARLEEKLRSAIGNNDLAGKGEAQKQLVDLNGSHVLEQMRDQANEAGQGWAGGLRIGLNQFVQDAGDSAKQVQSLMRETLTGVNSDISKVLMEIGERGHHNLGRELRNSLGQTARGVGGQVMNLGLQKAEAGVLGALGLGKPDGSDANPFTVRIKAGLPTTLPGMGTLFGSDGEEGQGDGGSSGAAKSGFKSFLGNVFGSLFGGGRATGGPTASGMTYLVGEHEPELLTMGSSAGHITPMSKLAGGGGGQPIAVTVDARGASDPAQTRRQAQRGAAEGFAAAQRQQGDAQRDAQRRRPLSAR